MTQTSFTRLVGAEAPIQLAAMPGITTPPLVAAVANAGGVGMCSAALMSSTDLESMLAAVARQTNGVFGVNFLMPFLDRSLVPIAARRARIVEFFYGEPEAELIERVHAEGALVSWQVGSVQEAESAERSGADFLVVQGIEAGGHVRGHSRLLPLLSQVMEAVRLPLVAAGGLATARDISAVLVAGAGGARLGTRFVATIESNAHPAYKEAIVRASADDTCLTEAFSVPWPDAPHRVLRSAVAAAEKDSAAVVGEVVMGERKLPVQRFSVLSPTVGSTGHIEAMALYAGESVSDIHSVEPAAAIMAQLLEGVKA